MPSQQNFETEKFFCHTITPFFLTPFQILCYTDKNMSSKNALKSELHNCKESSSLSLSLSLLLQFLIAAVIYLALDVKLFWTEALKLKLKLKNNSLSRL